MFTGLVEGVGEIRSAAITASGAHVAVDLGSVAQGVQPGDSIAVNGCCLTVTHLAGAVAGFDLLAETLARTNLGAMTAGRRVNLERALPAQGRYGGHFVTGHIDGTGEIRRWEQAGADYELRLGIEPAQGIYLVPKGCVAVDGISLTVAEVARDEFSVWIIPHTRAVTALHDRKPGERLNLEFDLLAKYTEKILAVRAATA